MMADLPAYPASRSDCPRLSAVAVAAVIAAFLLVDIFWIWLDQRVWPWDQAWYGEVTLDLWFARREGLEAWYTAMLHAIPSKPPLITWLAQFLLPITRISTHVEPVLLLANVAIAGGTLYIVYLVARQLRAGSVEALAAVVLCCSSPILIAFTHEFMVEELQALVAAAMLLVAIKAPSQPILRTFALCICVTALGFLTKTTTELFLLPFTLYAILVVLMIRGCERTKVGWLDGAIIIIAGLASFAAAAWYRTNWPYLFQHFTDATSSDVALNYGSPVVLTNKLRFWITSLAASISPIATLAALLFLIAAAGIAIALFRIAKKPFSDFCTALIDRGALFALASAGTVVATLLVYSLQINEDPRFLLPLLPVIAALLAWSLSVLKNRVISWLVLLAVLTNAAINHAFAFGLNPLRVTPVSWLRTIQWGGEDKAILTNVVDSTCSQAIANRYTIIGVEYVELNANSASFYSAKQRRLHGYRCYYTSLGYAEKDIDEAFRRLDRVGPDYFVTVVPEKQRTPDFLNEVSRPAAERIARDPRFVLAPGSGDYVLIYRRVR